MCSEGGGEGVPSCSSRTDGQTDMTKLIVTLSAVLRARLKRNRTKATAKTARVSTYQMTDPGKADLVYTSVLKDRDIFLLFL